MGGLPSHHVIYLNNWSEIPRPPLTEIYNLFTPDESYNFFCGVGYAQVKDATL